MKRFLAIFAALTLICGILAGCGAGKSGKYDITNYRDVRNGIAVVCNDLYLYDTDGQFVSGIRSQGTGFFVGKSGEDPQYIVTNHHVIANYQDYGKGETVEVTSADDPSIAMAKCYVKIYFDSQNYVEGYVIDSDPTRDIAVVKLDKPTDQRDPLVLMKPTDEVVGTDVYAIGYPGLSDNAAINPVDQWSITDATVTSGSVSRLITSSGTGVRSLQVDINFTHGNSGGPLVTPGGAVLGINSWSVNELYDVSVNGIDSATANYSVDISEVTDMLTRLGVVYDITDKDIVESGSLFSSTLLWVIVAVIVAIVIVVIVIVIVSGNFRKKKEEQRQREEELRRQEELLRIQEEQKRQRNGGNNEVNSKIPGDSGYRVQGVAGEYAGKRFALVYGKQMTFGRRDGIVIRYPDGTPGVSGEHCTIWVENGVVFIRDGVPGKPSTHGTYVNQNKLAGNQTVQLKVGDTVGIGSDKERFVIAQKG